jgi:hypothetical protein
MIFVFVDETGELGKRSIFSLGSTPYFGMVAISIVDRHYKALRLLLSQIHWLRGTATSIELRRTYNKSLDLMRGLRELANKGIVLASGLFINKSDYGGRFLKWSDIDIPKSEWQHYLRNYLLRHLLELHFSNSGTPADTVDLVLDRVTLSESQRRNTYDYLNGKTRQPLREPFAIPPIEYLTIGDSEYVGGLEIAHVLADILRETIKGEITPEVKEVSDFIRIEHFIGHEEKV